MTPNQIESIQEDEVAKFSKEKGGFRMGKGLSNKIGLAAIIGVISVLLNTSNPSYFYLKTIMVYYLAFISIQVILGMRQILMSKAMGRLALAIAIPTLFYWITDGIAINTGTWSITERTSTGNKLFDTLPIEEAVFFAITNIVIVQGLYLVELNYDLQFGRLNTKIKLAANPEITRKRNVTVIGAGIGGLAIAARLAKIGFNVTVYEKKDHVGGRLDIIRKDGHRFDVGPSLMLMPQFFGETYKDLGRDINDYMELIRCDPIYGVHFDDNQTLIISNDMNKMKLTLEQLEPGSFENFLQFLKEGHFHFSWSVMHVVGRNFAHFLEYFNPFKLPLLLKMKVFNNFYDYVSKFFNNEKLRQAFSFQNMYLGLSPYKAMATYSLLQYTEYSDGVWYPKGGMYQIAQTLYDIGKELGVKFEFNKEVDQIETNQSTKKVELLTFKDGTRVDNPDIVVCNADLPWAYKYMLKNDPQAPKIDKMNYTSSTIMFYWAVDKIYDKIRHHNIFLNGDYKKSYDQIFEEHTLPADPSFYVNAPKRSDPTVAPEGKDSLMVLVPVGHLTNNVNPKKWEETRQKARTFVVERLNKLIGEDIEPHITNEVSYTPLDWQRDYNLEKGATFGLSHNFMQVGYLRPRNKHDSINNLYFAGASTHPGSGLPLVLLSAKLTAERITDDL